MCGIYGQAKFTSRNSCKVSTSKYHRDLRHRGPDGFGQHARSGIILGHTRLAIIDLKSGQQPLSNETGDIWITFNGEIYNYKSLSLELKSLGHKFKTKSDTETIIHAYEQWGIDCVRRFRGMFAFAIADYSKRKLFLARDPFGIKPLYYHLSPEQLAFASEISPLYRSLQSITLDYSALDLYFQLQYIPAPKTIFTDIKKLPPGFILELDTSAKTVSLRKYWQFNFASPISETYSQALNRTRLILSDSVKTHLVSDVPVGAFLSGGVDSTLVVALMAKHLSHRLHTFSVDFEGSVTNETAYAHLVSRRFSTHHHSIIVTPADLIRELPKLSTAYGEPFADSSALQTSLVSRLAASKLKVVLSGDGGDEFFAGYNSYQNWHQLRFKWLNPAKAWLSQVEYMNQSDRAGLWQSSSYRPTPSAEKLFSLYIHNQSARNWTEKAQLTDINTYLPYDILTKVDIASMRYGLEVRTPLIDLRVAHLVATIQPEFLISKRLLKDLVAKEFGYNFAYRPKQGFNMPLETWFKNNPQIIKFTDSILLDPASKIFNFLSYAGVKRQLSIRNPSKLWQLLFLELWLRQL